jgi:hypothetical protein
MTQQAKRPENFQLNRREEIGRKDRSARRATLPFAPFFSAHALRLLRIAQQDSKRTARRKIEKDVCSIQLCFNTAIQ